MIKTREPRLPRRERIRMRQVEGYKEAERQRDEAPRGVVPEGQGQALRRTRRGGTTERKGG